MHVISTPRAPAPGGHYSQAVEANGLLFVSGQLPVDPLSGRLVTGTIEEQTLRALENLRAIVEAAGVSLGSVVKVTVYVADVADWPRVNLIYAGFFAEHRPARAIVPVGALHHGAKVEIDAVAAVAR